MRTHRKINQQRKHCNQLLCKWNLWKEKRHHVDSKAGHPTPIDRKNTNKGNVMTKLVNILFWGHPWDLKNVLVKFYVWQVFLRLEMSRIGSKIMGDMLRGQWGWWEDNMLWQNGEKILGDNGFWRQWWRDIMKCCWGDDEGHWATRRCKMMPSNAKEMSLGCWVTLKKC